MGPRGLATGDKFYTEGYAYSDKIDLPNGMKWDTLSVRKFEPTGTSIKISIADASKNAPINNFNNTTASDINISSLNNINQKSIRLVAYLKGTSTVTPTLTMWGISWHEEKTWRDAFIGSSKIDTYSINNLRLWNDRLKLDVDPLTWTKDASNPVLIYGSSGKWDDIMVYDPSFLSTGGTNYLYYVGGTAPTEKIGYASATDLKTYTKYASNPVLSASVGKFDSMGVRDPDVQFIDGYSKMYYAGRGASTGINFAVTSDMNAWTKYDPGPGFTPSAAGWDKGMVRDPSVIRVNNTYYMLYAANNTGFDLWRIGLAKSYDNGFFWTRPASNEVLDVGAGNKFDDMALRSPSVIFDKDRYLMFYVGKDVSTGTGKIGLATSTDGATWTRMNSGNAIVSPGVGWDSAHIVSVVAAVVNGNYELYYAADNGTGNLRIGHATSGRYTSATVVSKEIDLPPNGLWNGVFINKSEPSGTHINVSVLDATTGLALPGFADLTAGQINISTINFNTYPKLSLKAKFDGNGKATPVLFDWSVNWTLAKVTQSKKIPDRSFPEEGTADNLYDLSTYFTHERFSNKTLNYTVDSNSDAVNLSAAIDADGYHLDCAAPVVNWTGTSQLVIRISDGYMNITSNPFNVSVTNVNDPPVWLKIPDKHISEDTFVDNLVKLPDYFVDSDTPLASCTFSVTNPDTTNLTITLDAVNNIDVMPGENWTGTVSPRLTVSDGQYSSNITFRIIVDQVQDPPIWIPFGPIHLTEDTPAIKILNLETMARDAETPSAKMNYSSQDMTPKTVHAVVSSDHWMSLYPAENFTGQCSIKFFVNDGSFNVSITVQMIVDPVNDPPSWKPIPVLNITEDTRGLNLLNLDLWVVDAETPSSQLIFNLESVSEPTALVMIDASHTLNVTPGSNFNGNIIVMVSASDGTLRTYTNITIHVIPVNDPPIITSTPVKTAVVTEAYTYQVVAFDIEGTPLTYMLTSFISGMTINPTTGLIQWTPMATQSGSFEVRISVSDGEATVTQDYYLDVTPKNSGGNSPPVITSTPVTVAVVGQSYSYKVEAVDADNDKLTFSLIKQEAGMTMLSQTGQLSWFPQDNTEGTHPIVIAVSDGKAQVTQSYDLTVYPKGTVLNNPPVITSTPVTKALLGTEYNYQVVATDKDGDQLVFSLVLGPNGMTIAPSGLVRWTPTQTDVGTQHIVVKVTDGKANVTQAFLVTVGVGNHQPNITSSPGKEATVGQPFVYQMSATDQDGDGITYGISSGPKDMVIDSNTGRILWIPAKADVGKQTITVSASDGLFKANQTFELTVKEKKTVPTTVLGANMLWIIIVIIVVVILALVAVLATRKKVLPPIQETRAQGPEYRAVEPGPKPTRPPSPKDQEQKKVIHQPPEKPVTYEVKGEISEESLDLEKGPDDVPGPAKGTKAVHEPEETMVMDEGPKAKEAEKKDNSTEDILDEILGKVDGAKKDAQPVVATAVIAKEVPKAEAKPVSEEKLTVDIAGKSYTKEQILQTLSSLPRGLPSTLWGREMDDLSKDIVDAEYSHTPEGDVIVKLGKKWYFGDPKDLGTYLQPFKEK